MYGHPPKDKEAKYPAKGLAASAGIAGETREGRLSAAMLQGLVWRLEDRSGVGGGVPREDDTYTTPKG